MKYILSLIIPFGLACSLAAREKSFGEPEMTLVETTEREGKTILRYEHESVPEWGYENPQSDYFFVLPPEGAEGQPKGRPLQVVLHSAGHSGEAVLEQSFQEPGWFHNVGLEDQYVLYLDCRKNSRQDWWWGAQNNDLEGEYKDTYTPTEKRILTTIEWVIEKCQIDRNRVYLSGVSMGGSGSLGIGMCRGDIFATVNVTVPAGVDHIKARLFDRDVPDPPVLINFTSIGDGWSEGQEELIAECRNKRYHLVFAHGPSGHHGSVERYPAAAKNFPWRSIRKDEAYAVFTHASTDEEYPGFIYPLEGEYDFGQIGALFRWKSLKDTPSEFQMELKMVTKEEVNGNEELPTSATSEVSIRRLQNFKLDFRQGTWTLNRGGVTVQSGNVSLDANGLLTIGEVPLSTEPSVLTILSDVEYPAGSVRAEVADSSAAEEGQATGTFTITREGDTSSALDVNFTISGTATHLVDYNLSLSSPVTIPAGQSSVDITLTPIDNDVNEQTETASIAVGPGTGYTEISIPATISIADNDNTAPTVIAGPNQTISFIGERPWTPAEVATVAWFDASDEHTLWADDGVTPATTEVQRWDDKSGNNQHAVASGSKPTYTSASLTVSGSSTTPMALSADLYSAASSGCLVWVGTQDTAGGGWGNYGSNANIHSPWTTNYMYSAFLSGGRPQATAQTLDMLGTQTLQSRVQTGTNLEMWSDGAQIYNGAQTFKNSSLETKFFDYGSYSLNEVVFLPDADIATREKAEGYLAHKWGLAASLPDGHPYKDSGPVANGVTVSHTGASATDTDGDSLTTSWAIVSKDPIDASEPSFDDDSLVGATVTFGVAGTYVLRLTADDGYAQSFDEVSIVVSPPPSAKYITWSGGPFAHAFTDTALTSNPDGDSMSNLMEFAIGTDPTANDPGSLTIDGSSHGSPILMDAGGGAFEFYFIRRKDHGTSGSVRYTPQFSTDLGSFIDSPETPVWVTDSNTDPTNYEVVKVPFSAGTQFGRVKIVTEP